VEWTGSILVVDDDPETREMVVALLREEGLDARSVASVDEALEALRREGFEAILSDIQMPAKDGFTLLGEVRVHWNSIPVILMTSFGSEETADEARAAGAFDCLLKPFGGPALLETVRRALEARAALKDPITCR
jgi:DNA-binding NtrC family response regulator